MKLKKISEALSAANMSKDPNFSPSDNYSPSVPESPAEKITSGFRGLVKRITEEKKRKEEEPYRRALALMPAPGMKKGGKVSASKRADGICKKGKTKGRMI